MTKPDVDACTTDAVMIIDDRTIRLVSPDFDLIEDHGEVSGALADALRGLEKMRSSLLVSSELLLRMSATPTQVARLISGTFLPEAVANRLAGLVNEGPPLRLGLDVTPRWRHVPWEALRPAGSDHPLALHPNVSIYRRHSATRPVRTMAGPLRILVAIASPGTDDSRRLDYERELRNVLAATSLARGRNAEVTVLQFASTAEIKAALAATSPHILHISAHGVPGRIELEDTNGASRMIGAKEFVRHAVPRGAMPPLIVLSSCHTNVPAG